MAKRRLLKVTLAMLVICLLCIPFFYGPTNAQQTQDMVIVRTDYELLGITDLHGGGHLTYELRGRAAGDLRRAVLDSYDTLPVIGNANGRIDTAELRYSGSEGFIGELESSLTSTQFFAGSSRTYNPLHYGQGEDITVDAVGFVEVANVATDDTTPIRIYLYFDATGSGLGYEHFETVARDFIYALYGIDTPGKTYNAITDASYTARIQPNINTYTFQYKHTDYRISTGSMYKPSFQDGRMHVIRTPAGEISMFGITFQWSQMGSSIQQEEASFSTFNFFENPQILFIVVFVCGYLMASMPTRIYANFKYTYPRRYRHKALKITWLHILSKVLIIFLLLFYFFPTMLAFVSPNFFISGLALWIISIVMAIVIAVVAKVLYDHKAANIPKEYTQPPIRRVARAPAPRPVTRTRTPAGTTIVVQTTAEPKPVERPRPVSRPVPAPVVVQAPAPKPEKKGPPCEVCKKPITDYTDLTKCKCGKLYHEKCATIAENCTSCGFAFVEPAEPEVKTKNVQCPICGEMNEVPETADLLREKCKACGVMLEKVEAGYNYLVVDNTPKLAFQMFVSALKQGAKGLSISTTFPDKLRKEHDMSQADVIWLTDTSVSDQKTLNPHRLEFEMMRMYSSFVKNNPSSAVILDGFEYLVVENGFDKVFKFIKKVNDLSSVNNATMFVPIGTTSLEIDQLGTLKKEFDRVIVLADVDI
jgi:hypothetical protein